MRSNRKFKYLAVNKMVSEPKEGDIKRCMFRLLAALQKQMGADIFLDLAFIANRFSFFMLFQASL